MTRKPQEGSSRVTSKPVNSLRAQLGPCLSWIQPQAYPRDLGSKLLLNHPAQSMEILSPSFQLPEICPLPTSPFTLLPPARTESAEFLKHAVLCLPSGLCTSCSLSPNVLSLFSRPHQGKCFLTVHISAHVSPSRGRSSPHMNSGPFAALVFSSKNSQQLVSCVDRCVCVCAVCAPLS